jgi:hypothetical protein
MNNFKDLGLRPSSVGMAGEKVKIERLLNKEIVVLHFRIEDSNKKAGTKCLWLQIELEGQKRVLFTGAQALIEVIQKVPAAHFPFTTTITKDNERFEFS